MKILKWIVLNVIISAICNAQLLTTNLHPDTLEAVFKKSEQSKDGYHIKGAIVDIPYSIASKCDNKLIRVLGKSTSHFVTNDDLTKADSIGNVVYIQGRVGAYETYDIHSIYVFVEKRRLWMLVYNQQEDN